MPFKSINLFLLEMIVILLERTEDEVLVVLMEMQTFLLIDVVKLFEYMRIRSLSELHRLLSFVGSSVFIELI
jgi:hypothetical protein